MKIKFTINGEEIKPVDKVAVIEVEIDGNEIGDHTISKSQRILQEHINPYLKN